MLRRSVVREALWSKLNDSLVEVRSRLLAALGAQVSQEDQRRFAAEAEAQAILKSHEKSKLDAEMAEKRAKLGVGWTRLRFEISTLAEALRNITSTNAGVVALLQHCLTSHAASVAVAQGIDVRSVEVTLQKATAADGALPAGDDRVVGFIDAPHATEEEILVFASRLEKACPASRAHGRIEWRRKPT